MRTTTFIFLVLCAFIEGCTTYNPVTIAVSNAHGEPIPDASVQAAPMYFFNPTNNNYIIVGPYDILYPFPAKGDYGTTGLDGTVTLEIVTSNPLELRIYAQGYERWEGQLAITKQGEVEINPYQNKSMLNVTSH